MPISYTIDERRGLVLTVARGRLTDEDVIGLKERLVADPAFRPGMAELSDCRAVEALEVTPEGVRRMVAHDEAAADRVRGHRLAIVVSREVAFGMARMYQSLTSENVPGVRVFRDLDEARSWLLEGAAADR